MSEASDLSKEVRRLDDEALQKRFAALFDEGQNENAMRAFLAYCKSRGYHPSEIRLLHGRNLFERLHNMLHRQGALLEEYRLANKYLMEEAKRLNKNHAVLPPSPETLHRGNKFTKLIRLKFGDGDGGLKAALTWLGVTKPELRKMQWGNNVSDGLIQLLEDLPDYVRPPKAKRKAEETSKNARLRELEERFKHIPKPEKYDKRRSAMNSSELAKIGNYLFGDEWLAPMASFLGYSVPNIRMIREEKPDRYVSVEMERYLRRVERELREQGGMAATTLAPSRGKKQPKGAKSQ